MCSFDNVTVLGGNGPLLEETHYYPYGLTMAGISANALKGMNYPENRKKYNGIELTKDLDLNVYDAQFRNLDPQIGRWNQVDPKIESMEMWSPYASNYDNPIRFNDFLGDEPGDGDPGVLPAVGIAFLQKMDENLNAGVDAVMGAFRRCGSFFRRYSKWNESECYSWRISISFSFTICSLMSDKRRFIIVRRQLERLLRAYCQVVNLKQVLN